MLADMSNASIQLAIAPLVKEKNRVALFPGGTARLTGDACQPDHVVQWMWDTYVQVAGVANRLTKPGTVLVSRPRRITRWATSWSSTPRPP